MSYSPEERTASELALARLEKERQSLGAAEDKIRSEQPPRIGCGVIAALLFVFFLFWTLTGDLGAGGMLFVIASALIAGIVFFAVIKKGKQIESIRTRISDLDREILRHRRIVGA